MVVDLLPIQPLLRLFYFTLLKNYISLTFFQTFSSGTLKFLQKKKKFVWLLANKKKEEELEHILITAKQYGDSGLIFSLLLLLIGLALIQS